MQKEKDRFLVWTEVSDGKFTRLLVGLCRRVWTRKMSKRFLPWPIKDMTQYSFPAVALLSTTGKCLVSRTLHYVSISLLFTSHFNAFFTV